MEKAKVKTVVREFLAVIDKRIFSHATNAPGTFIYPDLIEEGKIYKVTVTRTVALSKAKEVKALYGYETIFSQVSIDLGRIGSINLTLPNKKVYEFVTPLNSPAAKILFENKKNSKK